MTHNHQKLAIRNVQSIYMVTMSKSGNARSCLYLGKIQSRELKGLGSSFLYQNVPKRLSWQPRCSLRMWRNNKNQRTIRIYKSFLTLHTVNFAPLTGILPSHTAIYVKHEKAGQSLPHIQSCDFIGEWYCWYSDHVTSTAHVTPMKSFDWLACRPLVLQLVSFDIAITWLG